MKKICFIICDHSSLSAFYNEVISQLMESYAVTVFDVKTENIVESQLLEQEINLVILKTHQSEALRIARAFELTGRRVINPVQATMLCHDRWAMHWFMTMNVLPWPRTKCVANPLDTLVLYNEESQFPIIMKPRYSRRFFDLKIYKTIEELRREVAYLQTGPVIIQEFIPGGDQIENRIFVVGRDAEYVSASQRTSKLQTGTVTSFNEVPIPVEEQWRQVARQISRASGLRIFGFDVIGDCIVDISQMQTPPNTQQHVQVVVNYLKQLADGT